jgi:predicted transcriptional regulator
MIDFACKKFKLDDVVKCGLGLTRSEFKILSFLINNQGSFKSNDLSKELKIDLTTSQRALKQLREKELIRRMQKNLSPGGYVFFYSITDKEEVKKRLMKIIYRWLKRVEEEVKLW